MKSKPKSETHLTDDVRVDRLGKLRVYGYLSYKTKIAIDAFLKSGSKCSICLGHLESDLKNALARHKSFRLV